MKEGTILFIGKHFNSSIKLEIITKYFNNEESLEILSKEYSIPRSTIFKWIKQSREGLDIMNKILIIKNNMKY